MPRIDETTAERLAHHWDAGWNGEDVALIMAPFAAGVVFSSPFVSLVTGDPTRTTIEGHDALRTYVENALRRTPGIRYTIQGSYAGADSVALVYTCFLPDGSVKHGVDTLRIDDQGQIVEWRCHYSDDSF
jgi:hypothetical protein